MDAVVAVYSDWGLGFEGTQPVIISADRARFRELTMGSTIVVGRKALSRLPGGKPLQGRKTYVISRHDDPVEGAVVMPSFGAAYPLVKDDEHCFVIGGPNVFLDSFCKIDRVYVTKIDCSPDSDSYFPNLDANPEWVCSSEGPEEVENGISYRFCVYDRIRG